MSVETTTSPVVDEVSAVPGETAEVQTPEADDNDGRSNRKKKIDYPVPTGGFASFPLPGLDENGKHLQKLDDNGKGVVTLDDDGNEVPVLVEDIEGQPVVEFDYDEHKKLAPSSFRNPLDYHRWIVAVHGPARISWKIQDQKDELISYRAKVKEDNAESQSQIDIADGLEVDESQKEAYVKLASFLDKNEGMDIQEMLANLQALKESKSS